MQFININDLSGYGSGTKVAAKDTSCTKSVNASRASSTDKLSTARNIKIGNATKSFDGSGNITYTLKECGFGNILVAQSDYTTNTLTGNTDHNIAITLPDYPVNSIAVGFMLLYIPSATWDTRIELRNPIHTNGYMYIRTIGSTSQKYTITVLWIIDARYAWTT